MSQLTIERCDPACAEAQACIRAYFAELQRRFEQGFDPQQSVSANPDELMPPRGSFLIARLDGVAVGCGGLKLQDNGYGELKRMWVAPAARGRGIGQQLLTALEAEACQMGIDVLQLDSNSELVEAHRLYLRNGYEEIAPYNDNPYAHHWFEKRGLG